MKKQTKVILGVLAGLALAGGLAWWSQNEKKETCDCQHSNS